MMVDPTAPLAAAIELVVSTATTAPAPATSGANAPALTTIMAAPPAMQTTPSQNCVTRGSTINRRRVISGSTLSLSQTGAIASRVICRTIGIGKTHAEQ